MKNANPFCLQPSNKRVATTKWILVCDFRHLVQPSVYSLWFFIQKSVNNIHKSPQFTPEVPKIMYLGIIFFTWPRKTIFIESPPQILGKFLIQFLVLESNGEFDTLNSETNQQSH